MYLASESTLYRLQRRYGLRAKKQTRYQDCALDGLTDRSRRPYRQANRLPFQIETLIVQLKKEHSSWGAP